MHCWMALPYVGTHTVPFGNASLTYTAWCSVPLQSPKAGVWSRLISVFITAGVGAIGIGTGGVKPANRWSIRVRRVTLINICAGCGGGHIQVCRWEEHHVANVQSFFDSTALEAGCTRSFGFSVWLKGYKTWSLHSVGLGGKPVANL